MQRSLYRIAFIAFAVFAVPFQIRAQAAIRPLISNLEVVRMPFVVDTVRESKEEGLDPISSSGLFMGVLGALGGAAIGGGQASSTCTKVCRTRSAAAGAAIGAGVMIPLGTFIGNRGRGNLLLSALATSVIGAAGFGLASALPGHPTSATVFLTAPLQIVLATKIEKSTTRK